MARAPIATSKEKPVVPEHVCPYVDMAIELIDNMAEENNREWRAAQAVLATALLEHVRVSAEKLRASSQYWYDKSQKQTSREQKNNSK
jgi:hypothetical protein